MKKVSLKFELKDDDGNVIFEHVREYRASELIATKTDVWAEFGKDFAKDARNRAFLNGHLDDYQGYVDIGYTPPKKE